MMLSTQPSTTYFSSPAASGAEGISTVDEKVQPAFVTIDELEAHLDLMSAFNELHHSVQAGGPVIDTTTSMPIASPTQLLFISKVQHRFDLWISNILRCPGRNPHSPLQDHELPPVDVLMFLHVYMLTPWNFYEDCSRIYPELAAIGSFPFAAARARIESGKTRLVPTPAQIEHWERLTGTAFDVPLHTAPTETISISCPKCCVELTVPWITDSDSGFGQSNFHTTCPGCNLDVTRDALCVGRFLQDISGTDAVAAHTLLTQSGRIDFDSAKALTQAISAVLGKPGPTGGDLFEWKLSSVILALTQDFEDDSLNKRLAYIMKAYTHPAQSGLDLGQAFLRQFRFIREMHNMGWANPAVCFNEKQATLANAITRYHMFLALNPTAMVACADIDLVFHTHQLLGPAFPRDSFALLDRLLDHDDSLERPTIIHDIRATSVIWQDAYGSPYVPRFPPFMLDGNDCTNTCSMVGKVPCDYKPKLSASDKSRELKD